MKICIIGHFSDDLDEGVRNVAKSMLKEISNKNNIYVKKIEITSLTNFLQLFKFKPDILHFFLTPSTRGLIIAKIISLFYIKSKCIISAIHPNVKNSKILKYFKPNLILVQTKKTEEFFKNLGFCTDYLLNGTDIDKFRPFDKENKNFLKKKYGIPNNKFIILHLASLKRERNLEVFKLLQKDESNQVIIIGRENENYDNELVKQLRKSGCEVWIKHFPKIEEIYNIADCYIFPTLDSKACIESPLSILEAMACNLPIITTSFGSIPEVFNERNDLMFVKNEHEIIDTIKRLKMNNKGNVNTRKLIIEYSLENIVQNTILIYEKILK